MNNPPTDSYVLPRWWRAGAILVYARRSIRPGAMRVACGVIWCRRWRFTVSICKMTWENTPGSTAAASGDGAGKPVDIRIAYRDRSGAPVPTGGRL